MRKEQADRADEVRAAVSSETRGAAAVVVTYNRPELLRVCLNSLGRQDDAFGRVIVVDNASTDGTADLVRRDYPHVDLQVLPHNVGGAGGFAFGIDYAISRGFDFAWLMDDDAAPEEGALAPLLEVLAHPAGASFAASAVVTATGDSPWDHLPVPVKVDRWAERPAVPDAVRADHASFVGVLVRLAAVRAIGLPVSDFFIWYDDFEFTRRLSETGPGYAVATSRIVHPAKQDRADVGERIYFVMRNSIWVARLLRPHEPLERTAWILRAVKRAAAQLLTGPNKARTVRLVLRGIWDGVRRPPTVPAVGSLVDEALPTAAP